MGGKDGILSEVGYLEDVSDLNPDLSVIALLSRSYGQLELHCLMQC
jgi:hypothetical protein